LEVPSSGLRVALAARHRPPLRLARVRAAGRLEEVGSAELAFSAAECAEYVRLATGRDPDPEAVEALFEATEGWPLGVALAVRSGDLARGGPTRELVHEYFAEEVLGDLDSDARLAVLAAGAAPDLEIARAAGL